LQHTQQGVVSIRQSETCLLISNKNTHKQNIEDVDLGFGLGLELTQRLVQHYGWQYSNSANATGHDVEICFSVNQG